MLFFIAAIFYSNISAAEIYEYKNQQNHKIFSDRFPAALQINTKTIQITTANNTRVQNQEDKDKATNFSEFNFISPRDHQTFWNTSEISVQLQSPKLSDKESLQISLDHTPINIGRKDNITVNDIAPGTHLLTAKILNEHQKTIKESNSITFYVHKSHKIDLQ